MKHKFFTCDVFTRHRFGGNPLAVLPDARGLSSQQMQQIAREFNYSETTFVLPAEQGHTRRVRIFTPTREVDFAGHPNIGTAFVLATSGEFGEPGPEHTVVFEELAGPVPVSIQQGEDGRLRCELKAPQVLSLGEEVSRELAASALRLDVSEISSATHPPIVASVGLPFLTVEVASPEALQKSRFNLETIEELEETGISPDILLYTRTEGDTHIRARMFAPLDGVPEDPATGSANCALAALLTHCHADASGDFEWSIRQGVEMGRPSFLEARNSKLDGRVTGTWIGGDCVLVSEGLFRTN